PLANDAAALDTARQNLSTYIEQTASQIESRKRSQVVPNETAPEASSTSQPGGKTPKGVHIITEKNGTKRIVVDDDEHKKAVKATKKKTSKPSPSPTPSP